MAARPSYDPAGDLAVVVANAMRLGTTGPCRQALAALRAGLGLHDNAGARDIEPALRARWLELHRVHLLQVLAEADGPVLADAMAVFKLVNPDGHAALLARLASLDRSQVV